jgi:hypothetical protein
VFRLKPLPRHHPNTASGNQFAQLLLMRLADLGSFLSVSVNVPRVCNPRFPSFPSRVLSICLKEGLSVSLSGPDRNLGQIGKYLVQELTALGIMH